MTVGIICLDGLDHRLASEHGIFDPVAASHQRLLNDLEGENPLFTPRVWNSLFVGRDQQDITGWIPEPRWKTATSDWVFLWDKVPATACLNLNLHTNYLHQNASMHNGWTPAHGTFDQMKESTMDLIGFWNDTLADRTPPLQIGYWRLPDAYGHRAGKEDLDMAPVYQWIRDQFWPAIDLPDQYLVLSDHGFHLNPGELPGTAAGREAHTEHGTVAATFDLDQMALSEFIPAWHGIITERIRQANMEALGYI